MGKRIDKRKMNLGDFTFMNFLSLILESSILRLGEEMEGGRGYVFIPGRGRGG